jgi:hypothetical protein
MFSNPGDSLSIEPAAIQFKVHISLCPQPDLMTSEWRTYTQSRFPESQSLLRDRKTGLLRGWEHWMNGSMTLIKKSKHQSQGPESHLQWPQPHHEAVEDRKGTREDALEH